MHVGVGGGGGGGLDGPDVGSMTECVCVWGGGGDTHRLVTCPLCMPGFIYSHELRVACMWGILIHVCLGLVDRGLGGTDLM